MKQNFAIQNKILAKQKKNSNDFLFKLCKKRYIVKFCNDNFLELPMHITKYCKTLQMQDTLAQSFTFHQLSGTRTASMT